jgi:hypothetical protein
MLISHRYKFICINIPKTGTATREHTFKEHIDLSFLDNKFKINHYNPRHTIAASARKEFTHNGWDWDNYFKFTFVRNPWYRYISFYNMWLSKGFISGDFSSWLGRGFFGSDFQSSYYLEEDQLILDKIYKYEELEDSIKDIFNIVGIEKNPLPLLNRNNAPKGGTLYDLSKYYTNQNLYDTVKRLEHDVINRIGYTLPA